MDEQPLVSIILPTYNGSSHIKQSIDSCLEQTYKKLELIIVDDGSFDETADIIKSYSDSRIKYFKHEKNLGLSKALNTGFALASGDFLTWQSDDNFFHIRAVARMVDFLEKNKDIDFVYTNFYFINEKGRILKSFKVGSPKTLDSGNRIGVCFLYRRIVYERLGGFDSRFYLSEDYEYWLRIRQNFKMKKINDFLCYYRYHKNSLTFQHKIAEIEEQGGKVISMYVFLPSIKYYHKGKLLFYKKNYGEARKALIKSLAYEPFNLDTWKLLIFVCLTILSPSLAKKIKEIRD